MLRKRKERSGALRIADAHRSWLSHRFTMALLASQTDFPSRPLGCSVLAPETGTNCGTSCKIWARMVSTRLPCASTCTPSQGIENFGVSVWGLKMCGGEPLSSFVCVSICLSEIVEWLLQLGYLLSLVRELCEESRSIRVFHTRSR